MGGFIFVKSVLNTLLVLLEHKHLLTHLLPLTSTWPHLRCDVGLEEGEYK